MRSTARTGLGSIHLSRRTLCGTALPQVNPPSGAARTSWVSFAANTKRFQTPRKQSSIYLRKAKKSPCGTIFRGTQHGAMGSYLPTGKAMHAEYITIYRVRNGQILEAWAEWDNLASLRQLGHL
jgi:ketosteroid isomerase-like protein